MSLEQKSEICTEQREDLENRLRIQDVLLLWTTNSGGHSGRALGVGERWEKRVLGDVQRSGWNLRCLETKSGGTWSN